MPSEKGAVHSNIPSTREFRVIDRQSDRQMGEIGLQAVPGTIFVLGDRVWEALSLKGLTLHARPIAWKPMFSHFRKRSQQGAFSRFLPESLKRDAGA